MVAGLLLLPAATPSPGSTIVIQQWSAVEYFPPSDSLVTASSVGANAGGLADSTSTLEWGVELNNRSGRVGRNVDIVLSASSSSTRLELKQHIEFVPLGRSFWGLSEGQELSLRSCDYKDFRLKIVKPIAFQNEEETAHVEPNVRLRFDGEGFQVEPGLNGGAVGTLWVGQTYEGRLQAVGNYTIETTSKLQQPVAQVGAPGFKGDGVQVGAVVGPYRAPYVSERVTGRDRSACSRLFDLQGRWTRRFEAERTIGTYID